MKNYQAIRPEDVLPEEVNFIMVKGVKVRKGTVAAVLANVKILDSDADAEQKKAAVEAIKALAPALVALDFNQYLTFNNPSIQGYIDDAAKKLSCLV